MKLNPLKKIRVKAMLMTMLLSCFFMQAQMHAQTAGKAAVTNTLLPYAASNLCLDQIVDVTNLPVWAARNMVVKDFDNDMLDDVALYDSIQQKLVIFRNNNGTGFVPVPLFTYSGLTRFHSVSAGDFDGDSDFDIAICFTDTLRILCNNGSLNFTQGYLINYNPGGICAPPYYMKAGKLNADNTDDIAILTARTGTSGVQVTAIRSVPVGPNTFSLVQDMSSPIALGPAIGRQDTLSLTLGNFDSGNGNQTNEIIVSNKRLINVMHLFKNTTVGGGALTFSLMPLNTANMVPFGTPSINIIKGEAVDIDNDGINEFFALARAYLPGTAYFGFAYFPGATNAATLANFQLPTGVTLYEFDPYSNYGDMSVDFVIEDINGDGKKDFIGINNSNLLIFPYDKTASNPNQPYTLSYSINIALPGAGFKPEELLFGQFDGNKIPDIYFKPWRSLPGSKPGVIPNFSYSISTTGDSVVCPGKTATVAIVAHPLGGTVPQHTLDWYRQPGGYITTGAVANIVNPGHYYPVLNVNMPVSNQTCTIKLTGGDTLVINPKPVPLVAVTPASYSVCPGHTITASATTSNAITFAWLAPGGNTISTGASMVSSPVTTLSTYTIVVQDIDGCMNSATLSANNFSPIPLGFSASKGSICPGDSNIITVLGGMAGSYTWAVSGNTLLSTSFTINVKPSVTTQYSVSALDTNGCPVSDVVNAIVDAQCSIKIYNAVTFNGDQDNSKWIIDNIERYPNNKASIFNRWGKRVAYIEGYNNKDKFWPAESDRKLPSSTYYYVLDLGDGSAKMKGWIELINN
jgi:gliding motility-associated-like protein